MKKLFTLISILLALAGSAQIGIGTTTPNSMLDVRGSFSIAVTTFSTNTTAGASDNMFLFNGTAATTLTLPTAVGITGRIYWVKNISSNSSTLTIATTASETIDGLGSWPITQANKAIRLISDGSNWYVAVESLPGNTSGTPWIHGGNNVTSLQNLGTTSNYDLPFITNNTEKMRLTTSGSLGIGSSTFNASFPERLLADAGASGNTNYQNVIVGKGNTNSYAQLNIQNTNTGTGASSDVVATADNGSETTNYVDMGINSSANTSGIMGAADDAYLYNIGQNFLMGTGTAAKSLVFMTGGTSQSTNERMRIDGSGNVGIGATTPNSMLDLRGSLALAVTTFSGATIAGSGNNMLLFNGTSAATLTLPTAVGITGRIYWVKNISSNSSTLTIATTSSQTIDGLNSWPITQANKAIRLISDGSNWYVAAESMPGTVGTPWIYGGNNVASVQNIGTTSNYDLPFITNNTEKMRLTSTGNLGIGTSTFNGTYPERLLADAGATGNTNFQNVIVGKGNTNSYAQLNIQNINAGAGASSDVVATADNGSETTNYVDMGINSSTNSSGVMGAEDDAYLYNIGQNFLLGTGTAAKSLVFMTGGTTQSTNERMRIDGSGNIGIGATTPNSTLDLRGSLALAVTTFSGATTAGSSNNMLLFNGNSPVTLTLPTAVGITGRVYWIKNISSNSSTLTIATTASQTIDGLSSWTLTQANKAMRVFSNGTNWYISSESMPGTVGTPWIYGGNSVASMQNIGTTSNYGLPFITNNTEKMRLTSTGNLGIGTSTFNGTYPERLLADAGATGNTNFQNVIVGKGNTNSYAQLNIQNTNAGTGASSDVVATADNGSETTNYVDMGINSSTNSSGVMGGADDAYLYNIGQNFLVGTGTSNKALVFMTGGTTQSTNERMRITGAGDVGIGITSPNYLLHIHKPSAASNWMQITNSATGTGTYDGFFYGVSASGQPQIWGEGDLALYTGSGTTNNLSMTITANGYTGIGTTTFNGTYPEQLIVDAGTPGTPGNYQNVIVGKGNTNSYAQLNIQNGSTGTSASSDVVATANNGSETVNYIDMGVNGGNNTSAGVLGGANTAYLYATGNNFVIGNGTNSKDILFFTSTAGTYTERMRITSAGHLIPAATNTYNLGSAAARWSTIYSNNVLNTSDARLKTNINDLDYGLNAVLKMRPVKFNWKEGIDKDRKIGFLAQELRKVVPEVVVGDETKETLGVNYIELIPVLVNAIKEQQKQIDELKKKVSALENK